jgi:hypothetical protein
MRAYDFLNSFGDFCELATEEHNENLVDFTATLWLNTSLFSLRYDRGNNYFETKYDISFHNYTAIFRNSDRTLTGTAACTFLSGQYLGKDVNYAYISDLRLSPAMEKEAKEKWFEFNKELITNISKVDEGKGAQVILTAVMDDNLKALKFFRKKVPAVDYTPIQSYESINLMFPLFQNSFKKKISVTKNMNYSELESFYIENTPDYLLGQSLPKRIEYQTLNWKHFSKDDFFGIYKGNELLGAFSLRRHTNKKMMLGKLHPLIRYGLKLFRAAGINTIKENSLVHTLYIENIIFKMGTTKELKTKALEESLRWIYVSTAKPGNFQIISLLHYPGLENHSFGNFRWVKLKSSGQLCEVHLKTNELFLSREDAKKKPIYFELSSY